jgi:hypothetical protein
MAAYASNLSGEDLLSEDQTYRRMARDNCTRRDWRFVLLSDALQHAFAHMNDIDHLEEPPANAQSIKDQILEWARHILLMFRAMSSDTPMLESLAILFRKIRYTYKLREALLGHVGYFNRSIELAADIPEGISST